MPLYPIIPHSFRCQMEGKRREERKDQAPETIASKAAKGLNGKNPALGALPRRSKKKKTAPTKNDPIRKYSQLGPKPMQSSIGWTFAPSIFQFIAWVSGKSRLPSEIDRTRPIVERNAYAVSPSGNRKIYKNNHPFKT